MSNFSQYGGVNPEWEELTKTTTIPESGPAQGQSIEEYQAVVNEGRETASNSYLQSSGIHSMCLCNLSSPSDHIRPPGPDFVQ